MNRYHVLLAISLLYLANGLIGPPVPADHWWAMVAEWLLLLKLSIRGGEFIAPFEV